MKKRKAIVIILIIVLCVVFSTPAFADDKEGYYKLDKTYSSEYYEESYDGDYYSGYFSSGYFTVPAKGRITFRYESNGYDDFDEAYFGIFEYDDDAEAKVSIKAQPKYNKAKGKYIYEKSMVLSKGKYYIGGGNEERAYKISLKYRPILGKTSITKLSAKKRGFAIKYKKASYATGYQIRYSTSSKMTKAKSAKTTKLYRTVSKLKSKKRYYVQVRSYKKVKVDGVMKTYYSAWSAKKYVKTK